MRSKSRFITTAILVCVAAVNSSCADSLVAPDPIPAVDTPAAIVRDSSLSAALNAASGRGKRKNGIERRKAFIDQLLGCEAFERLPDGTVRIATMPIPGRSFVDPTPQRVRVVALRLSDATGGASIAMQCGIPMGQDARQALKHLKHADVRALLADSTTSRVYTETMLASVRAKISLEARGEGVVNELWYQRQSAQSALLSYSLSSVADCPVNNPPSQGCTSLGGIQIVADVLPPHSGVGGFDTYGAGDGWDGYYARADMIMLQVESESGCVDISCSGTGVVPPESINGACPKDSLATGVPGPNPIIDWSATQTCTGAGTEACMYASPGVWVGSVSMSSTGGLTRHTATATVNSYGIRVTELYLSADVPPKNRIHIFGSTPHDHTFDEYTWARVAGAPWIEAATDAMIRATWEYSDSYYSGGSGRFTSSIIKGTGIVLSPSQRNYLGVSPGLCWCFTCLMA